jgi:hypothetical protein
VQAIIEQSSTEAVETGRGADEARLAAVTESRLEDVARAQDDRLSYYFRRWPRLEDDELSEMTELYRRRMRIARMIGRSRAA